MVAEIKTLLNLNFKKMQSFNEMRWMFKTGESRFLLGRNNEEIKTTLRKKTTDHLQFFVEIPPLASFEEHWHDAKETCRVISGEMADHAFPDKRWLQGETYHVDKYSPHEPYNPSPTNMLYLIVDFYLNP